MVHALSSVDPEKISNAQLFAILIAVRGEVSATRRENQSILEQMDSVKKEFKEYRESQKDMLETWSTARGVLKFIKFLAAIGIPITALAAIIGFRNAS